MKIDEYYNSFHPRFDLYSKEPIPFKNREQYLNQEFLSRNNMINWFKNQTMSVARSYAIELLYRFLVKRKSQGTLIAPCQTELRTLLIPSIVYFDKLFDIGFDNIVKNIGFQERFLYTDSKIRELPNTAKEGIPKIAQDSREQDPFNIQKSIITKLDFADYVGYEDWFSNIFIERKNLSDMINTISEFERFEKEIKRAKELNAYIIVLVEDSLNNFLDEGNYFRNSKVTNEYLAHNLRKLIRENLNLQFVFCRNRLDAEKYLINILKMGENAKMLDWQFILDKGLI
jgi:hypothetical protein